MTERTIRSVAKELAGVFYTEANGDMFGTAQTDRERSKRFRETYPTLRHFIRGMQVCRDGHINIDKPGWLFFVDAARKRLVQMLGGPNVSDSIKESIAKALIEENQKATDPKLAAELLQRRIGNGPTFS